LGKNQNEEFKSYDAFLKTNTGDYNLDCHFYPENSDLVQCIEFSIYNSYFEGELFAQTPDGKEVKTEMLKKMIDLFKKELKYYAMTLFLWDYESDCTTASDLLDAYKNYSLQYLKEGYCFGVIDSNVYPISSK